MLNCTYTKLIEVFWHLTVQIKTELAELELFE